MRIIKSIRELKEIIQLQKKSGKTVGLVPTMGYLHEGHVSLIKSSVSDNDFTVVSIFVNPTQFGPGEDLEKYPRDLERDSRLAEDAGTDIIFNPEVKEMYPEGFKSYVNVEGITEVLCGRSRPGHFRGVTTVVCKLFNIVEPDRAYFGQKDAQQLLVIKKMVTDLNMNVEIIPCPIIREEDGLAMSSRNVYLNKEEREQALVLSQSLLEAERIIKSGENNSDAVYNLIKEMICSKKLARIDYIEIVNTDTLEPVHKLKGKVLIALAVRFGSTRLIDNIMVEV